MALTKDQKAAQTAELKDKMSKAQSIMFAHYIGMNVQDISDLRQKLKEEDAEMKVAKKTLMKLAAKDAGLPEITDDSMEGPVACIFSFSDPLSGAQIAFKFAKDHKEVVLVGGMFEGKILSKEEATELAKLPGRDMLLATFVGMIRSPLTTFAGMCSSPMTGFARALSELAEKGGAGGKEKKEEAKEVKTEKDPEETKKDESSEAPSPAEDSNANNSPAKP
jgi:large subunit ribosomal protein L10